MGKLECCPFLKLVCHREFFRNGSVLQETAGRSEDEIKRCTIPANVRLYRLTET